MRILKLQRISLNPQTENSFNTRGEMDDQKLLRKLTITPHMYIQYNTDYGVRSYSRHKRIWESHHKYLRPLTITGGGIGYYRVLRTIVKYYPMEQNENLASKDNWYLAENGKVSISTFQTTP